MSDDRSRPQLSIVIVSWESGAVLLDCVGSLVMARNASATGVELIVVDNASREFPAEELVTCWPGVKLIRNDANRGFGPAANQGVGVGSGEIVLFLNPDTRVLGDPLSPLLQAFRDHPQAVAVAPRLVEGERSGEEPQERFQLRRLPSWPQATRELLLLDKAFPNSRGLRRDRYADHDRETSFEVEQPAAAAFAVRREAFLAIAGFDEAFVPAWFEDVDLCARLRAAGSILYWPASRFVHDGGTAREALGYDRFLPIYYRNAIRFWRKHHGVWAALAYRALVCMGMVLRLVAAPLGLRLPCRRRQAALAYLGVLCGTTGLTRPPGLSGERIVT